MIGEARKKLSELVKRAASGDAPVAIGRLGKEEAILVSAQKFAALGRKVRELSTLDRDPRPALAAFIAGRLLPGAPPHIATSQIKELASLTFEELAVLLPIAKLPLKAEQRAKVEAIRDGEVLSRLERRHKIAGTIAQATSDGLYEATEHRTSAIGVWDGDV
jgi:prevent-host-death family protein